MRDKSFWKQVEEDRNNGMNVYEVCKKYHINGEAIRRARYKGFLSDTKKLSCEEAEKCRERVRNMDSNEIVKIFNANNSSVRQTLNVLNLTESNTNRKMVQNILIRSGENIKTHNRIGKLSYSKEKFQEACSQVSNFTELSLHLGLTVHTINNVKFKELIQKYDIDISHWGINKSRRTFTHEEIFCENSRLPRTMIRSKILQFNVLDLQKCSQCGISEWQGQPLKIQVDHINGNSQDNRIENLRGLCPNCHSLTDTFGSKNQKKK